MERENIKGRLDFMTFVTYRGELAADLPEDSENMSTSQREA